MTKPKANRKENEKEKQSFWTTFPGIVTAIAALITAIAGLLVALNAVGIINTPTPTAMTPSMTSTSVSVVPLVTSPAATSTTAPLIPTPSATFSIPTPTVNASQSLGEFDHLIYEENFEDQIADGLEITSGRFEIVQTSDGNHVWRTDYNGTSELTLPTESSDYAIEARIMQVSATDAGQGTFWIRMEDGAPCKPSYLVYMVVLYDQVRLVEKDSSCEELQETGLSEDYYRDLSNGVWYIVRIEVKGAEVRVYWDGELILEGEDTDGDVKQSNVIGFAACCNEPFTHTFDFDDIRVWEIKP